MNDEPLFELQVDEEAGAYFKEAARWTNFISILYFIAIGCLMLSLFFIGAVVSGLGPSIFGGRDIGTAGTGAIVAVFIIIIGILATMAIMLYRFANMVRLGIERQDQATFNAGLRALKNYFIIYGVITVISVVSSLFRLF